MAYRCRSRGRPRSRSAVRLSTGATDSSARSSIALSVRAGLSAGSCRSTDSRARYRHPRQPFCEARSHCEMVASAAVDNGNETACQTYTQCVSDEPFLNRVSLLEALVNLKQPRALAGRAGLGDGQPSEVPHVSGGRGVASPRPPARGYHTPARGQSCTAPCGGSVEGCPRAGMWSGDARSRGRHTTSGVQDLQAVALG